MKNVQKACARLGWKLLQANPLYGGYAASLFSLLVQEESGARKTVIYKRLDPTRIAELELYRTILPEVPHAIPKVYGLVEEAEEQGLLLEAAGTPVKSIFGTLDREGQRTMLQSLVELLAHLHLSLREKSEVWLRSGQATTYPFESSAEWAQLAERELAWLASQGVCGVPEEAVREVKRMAAAFYPHYPQWAVGELTYTHGDPHLENILVQEERFRLIDWEWACVSLPQRDLSILLQDVLEEELHSFALEVFENRLQPEDREQFRHAFQACLFDNTLMMLGWEIQKYRNGYLHEEELNQIVPAKLKWLRTCYDMCRGR